MYPNRKVLTPRDIEILKYLMESKLLTRDQIKDKFFNSSTNIRIVNRRLSRLLELGVVHKKIQPYGHIYRFLYSLTPKGLVELQKFIPQLIRKPELSEKPDHDLMLVDIRMKLEKFSVVKHIFTENALQSYKWIKESKKFKPFIELNSDACMELDIGFSTELICIEHENSVQTSEFYEKRTKSYYQFCDSKCLVIARSKSTISKIQEIERRLVCELNCKPRIYYCLLSDFLKMENKIIFENNFGEEFVIS